MTNGMEILTQAWEKREGPAILATVNRAGKPKAIYVGEIWFDAREGFMVADDYFRTTRANIRNGSAGAVFFITRDRKAFQAKGAITYHLQGPVFESMRARHNPKRPGVAAVILRVEEAFRGAEKLC